MDYRELITNHSIEENDLSYPQWEEIGELLEKNISESEIHVAYLELAREWQQQIAQSFNRLADNDYTIFETANFLVLCDKKNPSKEKIQYFCERSLQLIKDQFGAAISDSGYGKHVVMAFNSVGQYFQYVSYYLSDGQNPASSGMCIRDGYNHIVIPFLTDYESPAIVITHELTHVLFSEYWLPNWLDEALAMRMEDIAVNYDGLVLDKEIYAQHIEYWNEETIQGFWSGAVWGDASEGFERSYELARIIWKKIAVDLKATKEEIVAFIQSADRADGGDSAFKAIFNHSLGELVQDFLGEGNWEPDVKIIKFQEEQYAELRRWLEESYHLTELDEPSLLEAPLSEFKLSSKLDSTLESLSIRTVSNLTQVSSKGLLQLEGVEEGAYSEITNKLQVFGLSLTCEECLHSLSHLFLLLENGRITSGYLERDQCVMMISIESLTSLIHPDYTQFKLVLENFEDHGFVPFREEDENQKEAERLSFEQISYLNLEVANSQIAVGAISLECINDSNESGREGRDFASGEFSFTASSFQLLDESSKEWSLEELGALVDEYWQGG